MEILQDRKFFGTEFFHEALTFLLILHYFLFSNFCETLMYTGFSLK